MMARSQHVVCGVISLFRTSGMSNTECYWRLEIGAW